MLRISKMTDYAIIVLGHMARDSERTYAATELAETASVAVPTVSKVLKSLARAKVLKSTRGARGGYRLARPPEMTSVARIIDALEGPIALTECGLQHDACQQSTTCQVRGNWAIINGAIKTALEAVTLADMAGTMTRMPDGFQVPLKTLVFQRPSRGEAITDSDCPPPSGPLPAVEANPLSRPINPD